MEISNKTNYLHAKLVNLLKDKNKTQKEVIDWLVSEGFSVEKSKSIVEKLQNQIKRHAKGDKQREIWGGLIICIIGILLTVFGTGFIWWGAIIFGAFRFFKGLAQDTVEENVLCENPKSEKSFYEITLEEEEIENRKREDERYKKHQSNIAKVIIGVIILFVLYRLGQQLFK